MAKEPTPQEQTENTIELDLDVQLQQQPQLQEHLSTSPPHCPTREKKEAEQEEEAPVLGLNYEKPPKSLSSRYNCTALGEYLDKQGNFVFKDAGQSITTSRDNTASVNDMLDVAQNKGWTDIKLRGSKEFRRAAWLEAQARGLGTKGYTPDERDLATLRDNLGQRQSNAIKPDGQERNSPQAATQTVPEPEVGGKLIGHGEAPYLFKNENAPSYYATLEKSDGTPVTMWGVGIKEVLEGHNIEQGDHIDLQKGGKVATTIQEPLHDEVGNVSGFQEKQVYRNEWVVDVLERATKELEPIPTQDQTAPPEPLQQAEDSASLSARAQQMREEALQFQREKEVQNPPESMPPLSARAAQAQEEAQQFQKEITPQKQSEQFLEKKPANTQVPETERHDDLGLREGEANKLQAQNEMPTLAQINTSPKADVDSDVRFKDVGGQSIPSDLSKDVQSWVNNPTSKQSRLNGRDQRVVSMMKSSVQDTLGALEPNARKQALRNYNENLDAAINGTTLNVPDHLKQQLQQQAPQPLHQQQAQQRHITPPIRDQEPEL